MDPLGHVCPHLGINRAGQRYLSSLADVTIAVDIFTDERFNFVYSLLKRR